jgi:Fe2+ or Zn2+ uptake regulation protein
MKTQLTEGEKICKEWSLRNTKTRRLLFQALFESRRPLSIPEFLDIFASEDERINKTTLYREVETLVNLGVLRAVQITPRKVSYELGSHEHHHHFACTKCDFITGVTFSEKSIERTEKALEEQGVQVTHHALEFFGLCSRCQ